jgi:hypothetical protein
MHDDESLSPYEVFDGTAWEAGLLKSILEDNDIEVIQSDASPMQFNLYPLSSTSVKLFVAHKDFDSASDIVKEFYTNMQKESSDDSEQ